MAKSYICQLSGGRMLAFQDGWVAVETTGYPLPDCSLTVGGKTYKGQDSILRVILGYQIEDMSAFVSGLVSIEPMLFDDFKYKAITENLGGGCSARLRDVTIGVHDEKLTLNKALFKYLMPVNCIDRSCTLPSDSDIVDEYSDMLRIPWESRVNTPNWKFRNNMILLTGCREVTEKHIVFVEDVVNICLTESERNKYKYISGITLSNGNGAVVLCDSYIGNADIAYLYQRVTGCDLSVGKIVCNVSDTGEVDAHFEYVEGGVKRHKMPELKGVVVRYPLN